MEVREPGAQYLKGAPLKRTEAGDLPVDWSAHALSDLVSSRQLGGNYRNGESETDWPLIKMGNLGRGRIDLARLEFIDASVLPQPKDRLRLGDVLFNTRNTLDLVGKVAIWSGELPEAYFNSNLMRLEFDGLRVGSNRYMNFALNSHRSVAAFRAIATGTTSVAAIYSRDFSQVFLPVPAKAEQQAIASALSDADTLIDSLGQLLSKQRQIKQGAMQELLTGQRRLPGFAAEWHEVSFGEVAQPSRERVVPLSLPNAPQCVELEHIQAGEGCLVGQVPESRQAGLKTVFSKEDVLFGKLRAYQRKYWFAEFEGVCSTEIWALRPIGALESSALLYCLVQRDDFIEVASSAYGTHMPRSDWNVVKAFRFELPTDPAEQHAIAQVLTDMDLALTALQARLAKARDLKQALMQVLLTGRIRLRPPAAPDAGPG